MTSTTERDGTRPRVLVLGGGFAGVGAARKLAKADVDVVVIDANDFHTFTPMIYQLATGLIGTEAVAHPLRDIFDNQANAIVHQAAVQRIDLAARRVEFTDMDPSDYDFLVLALGAEAEFFGVDGAADHGFPLYGVRDAVRLRQHILRRWEAADRDHSLVADGALNIVVVGGGPTGVESAGALAELYHGNFVRDYPELPVDEARIILVEAGPQLFSMFNDDIRAYTTKALESRGVELKLGEVVAKVTPTAVILKSGETLPAHTLVWGAGLHASPVAASLGIDLERGGRVPVGADLALAEHPEVFAAGDCAWIVDAETEHVLPQLGSVALQSGQHVARTILRRVAGKESKPFAYRDKGTMAAIGRGAAVMQTHGGRAVKGKAAWLAWGAVHLSLLSTGEDRVKALVDWTWAGFTHERGHRIALDEPERTLEGSQR